MFVSAVNKHVYFLWLGVHADFTTLALFLNKRLLESL